MNRNVLIVLAGGFVIAILVAVLVQATLSSGKKQAPVTAEKKVEILVATKDLKIGRELEGADMRWQSWPQAAVFAGAITRKDQQQPLDAAKGRLARNVAKDEPVLQTALVANEGNFLAATLKPGMRAVAIKVNPENMVGGFSGPGDYVDVLLTYKVKVKIESGKADWMAKEAVSTNIDKWATETILQNIRVLAVDQEASREDESKGKVAKTVTLEVDMRNAEKLSLAQEMGELTLALRGIGDDKIAEEKWPATTDVRMTRIEDEIYEQYDAMKKNTRTERKNVRIYAGDNIEDLSTR